MEPAATTGRSPPPLRLLSLDGGGIRGISELIILDEIMHRVQQAQKLESVPLPADYFDLICGTSTGGLIALLLGRLRLSVPEAIDKYRQLSKQVFSDKKSFFKDGKFKASNLEKAIKDVVEWKLGEGRAEEKMFTNENVGCKAFVCAVPAIHVNREPKLFRTWCADKNPGYNCTIWEAGRATSAAPTFFKRICIGKAGMQEEFVDAGIGCNNPVQYLVEEAQREFGSERDIACIVSIGTGKPKIAGFKAPGLFQRMLPLDLVKVLAAMATDSEVVALAMQTRYQHCDGLYHRLNVERGLEGVSLGEWEKLGEVTTHTVEYLRGKDVSQRLDLIVNALLGKPARTFRLTNLDRSSPAELPIREHFMYPTYKVRHYVEREGLIEKIIGELQAPGDVLRPIVFVLLGMGGCGKSQLALEYCYQAERSRIYSIIFWIDATSPNTAQKGFTVAAQAMSKPNFSISDDEGNLRFVQSALDSWAGNWLLVFDNFDDPKAFSDKSLKDYFPRQGQGSILITGRHEVARSLGHHIDISIMSEEEALELLLRRSQIDRTNLNLQEGRNIVKRLGYHALAIDQAGAYIIARNLDIKLYLTHYDGRRERVLNEAPELWDYKRKLKDSAETETKLTVFTTWELSFDLISGDDTAREDKEHILTLIAFFDGKELTDALFEPYAVGNKGWMTSCRNDEEWNSFEFQDVLTELRKLSLLQSLRVTSEGASFTLHPLIQDWIKLRGSSESRQSFAKEATLVLGWFLAHQNFDRMTLLARQATLAHVDIVLANKQEYLSHEFCSRYPNILNSMSWVAGFLKEQGRYGMAESLYLCILEGRKLLLGDNHPTTLSSMSNYCSSLRTQGKYDEAEPIYRQTLGLREKILGTEHPDTLVSMNNLALLLKSQGKYDKAEPIYRQTVALQERIIGKEHPHTLASMNNLASLLESQGKYDEAEPIYRQTLGLREKILGTEHPNTLISMNNLALLLKTQGKYDEAEPIFRQTLVLREKVLGTEHPQTLTSMNNLALLLEAQGKYDEAEPIYRQTLKLQERILGAEHPDTLSSMNNLASLLESQGKYDKAEPISRQTLALQERILGTEHPDTLISMNNLALLLKSQGKYDQAEPIYRQTLKLQERILGTEHPDTLNSMNNLASLLKTQGKYDEAELIYRQTLVLQEKTLGTKHPDTLASMYNLASLLEKQETFEEAEVLFRRELRACEVLYGINHTETMHSRENLAALLEKMGKSGEAEVIRQQLADIADDSKRENSVDVSEGATISDDLRGMKPGEVEHQTEDIERHEA